MYLNGQLFLDNLHCYHMHLQLFNKLFFMKNKEFLLVLTITSIAYHILFGYLISNHDEQ